LFERTSWALFGGRPPVNVASTERDFIGFTAARGLPARRPTGHLRAARRAGWPGGGPFPDAMRSIAVARRRIAMVPGWDFRPEQRVHRFFGE